MLLLMSGKQAFDGIYNRQKNRNRSILSRMERRANECRIHLQNLTKQIQQEQFVDNSNLAAKLYKSDRFKKPKDIDIQQMVKKSQKDDLQQLKNIQQAASQIIVDGGYSFDWNDMYKLMASVQVDKQQDKSQSLQIDILVKSKQLTK